MTWLDYHHIKTSVPIEKVFAHYNIQLIKTSDHNYTRACNIPSNSCDHFINISRSRTSWNDDMVGGFKKTKLFFIFAASSSTA